ncbi:probable disease resistance protein At4g27220 isoform X2 [Diospyros lotus]|uniref:probable disease resistance protein At4g27220 isoform X2 n=1 Tax=Diospyros lotus TaxID=55363 RepID=UPI002250BCA2|nr:probable disease resistance protein At4g27220 isoform X2 [Diospyros lotus]
MDACVGKIVQLLADGLINYVKRHGAYVIRYKNKVQLLEQENKRLGEKKESIQGMVGRATNNGKAVETEVSSWLKDAEDMEGDITNILHPQENRESFKCFKGCMCPNLMWRHKMGKEADKRKLDVSELISRGDRLLNSPVARDAPFQWEPHFDSYEYYTKFDSRASVFDKIMEALKDSGVDMIGVHGPGGAGKTTMVKEVAKEAKKLGIFFKIVIAVVSKDPNTSKLQEELAPQLDLKYKQRSDSGRADELRKTLLNGKKILVILDDLWQGLDLNAVGIPISGPSHKDCKILLTSRRKDVFKVMGVHSYFSIGYLAENEAWELFTKVTGDFGVDELIAREVSKKCGGLPIAIVAVAAALKDEEEVEWRNALLQLKNSPLKYIEEIDPVGYTPLKWSYDFLKDEDAKSCFLLCCLFPEDAEISIDDLVKYSFALGFLRRVDTLKDARIEVQAMVNKLKRSCLLLNGEDENYVKMHDVIRDLAISITEVKQTEHSGGQDWPRQQQFMVDHEIRVWPKNDAWKQHTAISLRINNDNFPSHCGVLDCPLVHTLVLKLGKSSRIIPNDFFQGMEEARVLDLESISLELPSSILELYHFRMLRLRYCKLLGDLTTIQNLKNHIEILSFEGSEIKELPQEIGELTRLRSLDLRTWMLEVIPKGVISNLIHLEELYVLGSFSGWDTTVNGEGKSNASIAELKSLTQLTVLYVSISAESFKIMVQGCPNLFGKLINFAILINSRSSFINRIQTLNVLEIRDIHRIDDEFHLLMNKVSVLTLRWIPHLEGLMLQCKPQLKFIASGGGPFSKLTSLEIDNCHGLKFLFSSSIARELQQLQKLKVSCCSKMEQIIGAVDHHHGDKVVTDEAIIFSRLVDLKLSSLSHFKSFYPKMEKTTTEKNLPNFTATTESIFDEKVAIPKMKTLRLERLNCTRQIQLWDLVITQEYLQEHPYDVTLIGCQVSTKVLSHHLNQSFRMIDNLCLTNCLGFKHLIDLDGTISVGEEKFVDAGTLHLSDLPELVSLWNKNLREIKGFRSLTIIAIMKCPQMKSLLTHSMVMTLQHLEMLRVESCEMMEEIIIIDENNLNIVGEGKATWQIEFPKLECLCLYNLPNLKYFCNDERASFSFSSLCEVKVRNCPKMKTFASGQICLPPKMIRALVDYEDKRQYEEVEITNLNAFLEDRNHMAKIIHWGDSRSRYFMEIF